MESQPQNTELGRLYYSFSDFLIVYLKAIDHLNIKLLLLNKHSARF